MRLVFSSTDHLNTTISDDRGFVRYTISTPRGSKKVTTITKYRWSGSIGVSETMGNIEWHRLKATAFRFNGEVTLADEMLETRLWKSGRYFVGPDGQTYKWKIESAHCWMKPAESDVELVRFHHKNLGILKQSHPAYLDVSPKVISMLDHVILTFVYVESLRRPGGVTVHRLNNTHDRGTTSATSDGILDRTLFHTCATKNATMAGTI